MTDLRHVAAPPWEDDLFVAGEFARIAHVWSLTSGARRASFGTVFDFGGRRLAIVTGDQPMVVAGAWERHGVCGYTLAGEQVWQNKGRSRVQAVAALAGSLVAISYEAQPTLVLAASSGEEVRWLRGVSQVIALRPELSLAVSSTSVRLIDAALDPIGRRMALRSFAVLAAAASSDHVAIAEAAGPLRIVDLDGRERAAFAVPGGHVTHVAHDPKTATWVAVALQVDTNVTTLARLTDDAEVLDQRACEFVFDATPMRGGRVLVLAGGAGLRVLDSSDLTSRQLESAPGGPPAGGTADNCP